ncbi:MAG: T9SS type A sorting domain-containing protein [Bacteroidetes bacterium]|nr:T9SS type A sorting domain-containing protein [Bacteroidota bacterium]
MFPNPVNTSLSVFSDLMKDQAEMCIRDLTGQEIACQSMNGTNHLVDVSDLSDGFYFLSIKSGKMVSYKRFVIER